jgi:hypothetical protein
MSLPSQLQFRCLPAEARAAAIRRLALQGRDAADISIQTGLPVEEIRPQLSIAPPVPAGRWRRRTADATATTPYALQLRPD